MPRLWVSPGSCCSSRPFPLGDHSPGGPRLGMALGVPRSPLRSSPPLPSRVNRRDGQGRGRLLPALPFPWCHPAGTPAEGSASSSPFPFPASGPGLGLPHRRVGQVLVPSPAPGLLAPHRRGLGGSPKCPRSLQGQSRVRAPLPSPTSSCFSSTQRPRAWAARAPRPRPPRRLSWERTVLATQKPRKPTEENAPTLPAAPPLRTAPGADGARPPPRPPRTEKPPAAKMLPPAPITLCQSRH